MSLYSPHLFSCTNRRPDDHPRGSCGAKNAEALRQYLREKLKQVVEDPRSGTPDVIRGIARIKEARANVAGCLDQCENGPVLVVYPEGIWYRAATTDDIDRIVEEHLVGGNIVTDLQLTERVKK